MKKNPISTSGCCVYVTAWALLLFLGGTCIQTEHLRLRHPIPGVTAVTNPK